MRLHIGRSLGGLALWAICFAAGDLFADEPPFQRSVLVRWAAVEFAWGYRLEIKDEGERVVLTRDTRAVEMRFKLVPGNYFFRVTALDKFRKAAGATDWRALTVKAPSRFQWSALLPGLPLLRRGDSGGYAWLGAFALPLLLAGREFQAAASGNRSLRVEIPANLFDGPGVLLLPEDSRTDIAAASPLLLVSLDAQNRLITGRDRNIRNYFSLVSLAVLVHAVHLYYFRDYGYETDAAAGGRGFHGIFGHGSRPALRPVLDIEPAGHSSIRRGFRGSGSRAARFRVGIRAAF